MISNAIKYSRIDQELAMVNIYLTISTENIDIIITYNGIGIPEEHQEKVFDMFYRATSDNPGSGFGLYIVKETVKKLKGDIQMESRFGFGTTFKLNFPNYPEESINNNPAKTSLIN